MKQIAIFLAEGFEEIEGLDVEFATKYSGDQYKVCEIDKKDMKRMEDYEGEWPKTL